jgi:hypothetical protein
MIIIYCIHSWHILTLMFYDVIGGHQLFGGHVIIGVWRSMANWMLSKNSTYQGVPSC